MWEAYASKRAIRGYGFMSRELTVSRDRARFEQSEALLVFKSGDFSRGELGLVGICSVGLVVDVVLGNIDLQSAESSDGADL